MRPRWTRFKRSARLYWAAARGKSLACQDAFDGYPHEPHDWRSLFTERTFHCQGWPR